MDTRREHLLFQMIVNLASAIGEVQQTMLGFADNFPEDHQRELLDHSNAITAQLNELMARAKEYQKS